MTAASQFVASDPRITDVALRKDSVALWYAAHTRPRHEKRVGRALAAKAVEHYVPLYQAARQWKNGRHLVLMPLFPGYVFVRMALCDRLNALRVHGVLQLVSAGGAPVPLEESEVTSLRRALTQGGHAEPHPFINEGRKVRVTAGVFTGLQGFVVRRKGRLQVVVSIELIQQSVRLEIDSVELELVV